MPWLNHPSFQALRRKLRPHLQRRRFVYRQIQRIVFLCGGANSDRREQIKKFLDKNFSKDLLIFYADDVWDAIAEKGQNALEMEERLAQLSDIVLIVVESPGTFAEIGAFSLSPPLRKKLLAVVDAKYRNDESFIKNGPIAWIESDSLFGPVVWAPFNSILQCGGELKERIGKSSRHTITRSYNVKNNPKHIVFLIKEFVSIFGPCTPRHISAFMEPTISLEEPLVATYLALAKSMGLVDEVNHKSNKYYLPIVNGDQIDVFKRQYDLPKLRLEVLGVIQRFDVAQELLWKEKRAD